MISDELRDFLGRHIATYEHLEVILLLRRQADREWSSGNVAEKLRIPTASASQSLDDLCRANLLDVRVGGRDVLFRYRPVTVALAAKVDELARAYRDSRVEVVALMTTNAMERMKKSAIQTFADAFRLGKKDEDA